MRRAAAFVVLALDPWRLSQLAAGRDADALMQEMWRQVSR